MVGVTKGVVRLPLHAQATIHVYRYTLLNVVGVVSLTCQSECLDRNWKWRDDCGCLKMATNHGHWVIRNRWSSPTRTRRGQSCPPIKTGLTSCSGFPLTSKALVCIVGVRTKMTASGPVLPELTDIWGGRNERGKVKEEERRKED